ncbi:DUF2957 domain-containing protein [Burkholderia vietnamiensis]|uniref:DUF2957 domain-containing protein n=1 Tax=Burkholderia vietnamiensis TaxID=60552 RepID=A0AAW7SVW9_BURVI|nr:DUF2957 domain-containing protein [Burkholderia vietnamiensis]MBH9645867.1 DUF2957 domain-containing protein [Burkholderia vietnamiensis]MBR8008824.1 DUF2957 domain-containing protein [Burkholderia vietnamiensis]MDN7551317.1 DUF2957 domain-containing protein [Burkholderia vietnamiensis]MDN7795131.1 DUF2957 domain-containing protein [Burkholderia vietnamiensis]MDN8045143.1 DUF2957 domain-containing protein [Burkholderia vietnamiensis]
MKWMLTLVLTLGASFLAACSGGRDSHGDTAVVQAQKICPSSVDYSTVWTGASGSGEVVKVQLDTTKMTWRITYVESVVPATAGTAEPSRAGDSQTGTLTQETQLPTQSLNNCTFRLDGASLDPTMPARVFIGQGVIGGTIPGKEVQYPGLLGIGVIPDTTFRFFPFVAFSALNTDLTTFASGMTYRQLGFALRLTAPSGQANFQSAPIDATFRFNDDGSYVKCDTTGQFAGKCRQAGMNFVQSLDGSGAFESDSYQSQLPATAAAAPQGKAFMVVGKVRGEDVAVLVRKGAVGATLPNIVVDDEVGFSVLAPQSTIGPQAVDGEYVAFDTTIPQGGNNDQFNFRALLAKGTQATLLDPFNPSDPATATGLNIDYTQQTPGVLTVSNIDSSKAPTAASLIVHGGVFGYIDHSNPTPYFVGGVIAQ